MVFSSLFNQHGLSLDRLRAFLEVVDAGSIVKAAGGDVNRQSQYSRQIKELEVFFSVELTERKGRRISITAEGERLAGLIRASFESFSDFRDDARNEPRRVVVAGGASVIEWLIAPAYSGLCEALDSALVETQSMRTNDIVRAIDDGSVHLGIIRDDAIPSSFEQIGLGAIKYRLFLPKAFRPKQSPRSAKQWSALLSVLPQARLKEGGRLRSAIDVAHESLAIRPKVVMESSSLLQLAAMVRHGHCGAILPSIAKSVMGDDIVDFPLTGLMSYQRELKLVYKASMLERRNWSEAHIVKFKKHLVH